MKFAATATYGGVKPLPCVWHLTWIISTAILRLFLSSTYSQIITAISIVINCKVYTAFAINFIKGSEKC